MPASASSPSMRWPKIIFNWSCPRPGPRPGDPGQFVNLLCRSEVTHDPLLRRPLSLYWSEGDRLGLLFRVVGRGTRLLAQLSPGDEVDLLGPLGTGFRFTHLDASSAVLLIGGGVGTPPIFHLSQRLHALGVPPDAYWGLPPGSR